MPLNKAQVDAIIDNAFTDPFNQQNSALKARQALKAITGNYVNQNDIDAGIGSISVLQYKTGGLVPGKLYFVTGASVYVRPTKQNPFEFFNKVFATTSLDEPCIWDPGTNTIELLEPLVGQKVTYDEWSPTTVYTVGTPESRVTRVTKLFVYINAGPTAGRDPFLEENIGVYWREISPAPPEFGYSYDDVLADDGYEVNGRKKDVVRKLRSGNIELFQAVFAGQPNPKYYLSTDFEAELTAGDWVPVGGSGSADANMARVLNKTRTEISTLGGLNQISTKNQYRITDSADGIIRVDGVSSSSVSVYAFNETTGQPGTYNFAGDEFTASGGGGGTGNISEVLTAGNVAILDMAFANGKQLWFLNEDATDQAYLGFDGTDLGDTPELKLKYLSTFIAEGLEGEERLRLDELGGKITGSIDGNPDDISEVGAGYNSGLGLAVASMFADDGTDSTLFQVRPAGLFLNGSPYAPGGGGSQDLADTLGFGSETDGHDIRLNLADNLLFETGDDDIVFSINVNNGLEITSPGGLSLNTAGTANTRTPFFVNKTGDDGRHNIRLRSIRDSDGNSMAELALTNGIGGDTGLFMLDETGTFRNGFRFEQTDEHYPVILDSNARTYTFKENSIWINDTEPDDGYYLRHIDGVGLVYDAGPSLTGLPVSVDGDVFQNQGGVVVATEYIQDSAGARFINVNSREFYFPNTDQAAQLGDSFGWVFKDNATNTALQLESTTRYLTYPTSGFKALEATETDLVFNDVNNVLSIQGSSRVLSDSGSLASLDWENKYLGDGSQHSYNYGSRQFVNSSGTIIAEHSTGFIFVDSGGTNVSADMEARQLKRPLDGGLVVADWSGENPVFNKGLKTGNGSGSYAILTTNIFGHDPDTSNITNSAFVSRPGSLAETLGIEFYATTPGGDYEFVMRSEYQAENSGINRGQVFHRMNNSLSKFGVAWDDTDKGTYFQDGRLILNSRFSGSYDPETIGGKLLIDANDTVNMNWQSVVVESGNIGVYQTRYSDESNNSLFKTAFVKGAASSQVIDGWTVPFQGEVKSSLKDVDDSGSGFAWKFTDESFPRFQIFGDADNAIHVKNDVGNYLLRLSKNGELLTSDSTGANLIRLGSDGLIDFLAGVGGYTATAGAGDVVPLAVQGWLPFKIGGALVVVPFFPIGV